MNQHISTGLDGKPHVWPASAVSRDTKGVYRDIKGRVVGGVAMDAASTNVDDDAAIARKIARATAKVKAEMDADSKADRAVRRLFPFLMDMAAEDGMEEENEANFGGSEEGEAEDSDTSFEQSIIAANVESKRYWAEMKAKVSRPVARYPNAGYQHSKAALGSKATDAVARNAKAARPYSAFTSSARLCKGLHK